MLIHLESKTTVFFNLSRQRFYVYAESIRKMKKKCIYIEPIAVWSGLEPEAIVCDSYNSGIDDIDYEQIDLTLNP